MSAPVAARQECEWSRLTDGLIRDIASYLHPNEVATGLKLLNHETARCLKDYRRIQLSQPLTPAPSWASSNEPVHVAAQSWPSTAFVAHWGRPEPWRPFSLRQRRRLLCLAANSGCAASLEAALSHCGCSLTSDVAVAAALGGSVAACETLLIREAGDGTARLEDISAEAGHLALLRWLRQARRSGQLHHLPPLMRQSEREPEELATACAACRGGHAHILAWLQQEDQQPQPQPELQQPAPDALFGAVVAGPLTIAHPKAVPFLAAAAAAGGHVQLLDQLLPRLEPLPTGAAIGALEAAAQGCPLEAVQRVYGRLYVGGAFNLDARTKQTLAVRAAVSATADWTQKLDWVMQQQPDARLPGHPNPLHSLLTDAQVLGRAAGTLPHWLRRLQALQARGVPLPSLPVLAARAAAAGDVAALTWLLDEQGAEMAVSEELEEAAAVGGHTAVLAALSDRGHTFSEAVVRRAALAGRAAAVAWLFAQPQQQSLVAGSADMALAEVFLGLAASGADLAMLRRLHEQHGAPIGLQAVILHGSVEALEWALEVLQRKPAARLGGALRMEGLLRRIKRDTAWRAARSGNLAAADFLSQLLASMGLGGPDILAASVDDSQFVFGSQQEQSLFDARRWWLRRRQETRGAVREMRLNEDGYGYTAPEVRVGALADSEWRALLARVASSAFTAPAWPGEWRHSRAQWEWLVAKRLEAAAQAEAAGQAGAVEAARAEADELARAAAAAPAEAFVDPALMLELVDQAMAQADVAAAAAEQADVAAAAAEQADVAAAAAEQADDEQVGAAAGGEGVQPPLGD
ncbi:hypothetical protein HXX76_013237 [Chlamydomonas incerta]|uniref:Uncharacterized protein n=1 Tax=Chlamydomonas incerta TaxID=51695 RepID=A0A835SJF2_CHLIN|nr:hypothetical protein HXX76_013237 [Chlamydomonas incerta]|eukprot:KAG2426047.1 hypothetical protein HXX76_013237 [Chlamydomonas incerta]